MQARVQEWKGEDVEKQRRVVELKEHSYMFTSYDPGVTQMYSERFPWIAARNLVVVCTNKTAMTLDLALLLKSLITSGKFFPRNTIIIVQY